MSRDGGQCGLWDTLYLSNVVVSSKTKGMLNYCAMLTDGTVVSCFKCEYHKTLHCKLPSPVNWPIRTSNRCLQLAPGAGKSHYSRRSALFSQETEWANNSNVREIATRQEKCHAEGVACFNGSASEESLLFASSSLSELDCKIVRIFA